MTSETRTKLKEVFNREEKKPLTGQILFNTIMGHLRENNKYLPWRLCVSKTIYNLLDSNPDGVKSKYIDVVRLFIGEDRIDIDESMIMLACYPPIREVYFHMHVPNTSLSISERYRDREWDF